MTYITASSTAREASTQDRCPLCDHPDYCFLISEPGGDIYRILCSRTSSDQAPLGWRYYGQSKDNRQKFIKDGYRRQRKSKKFPAAVRLDPQPKKDIPQWQDVQVPLNEAQKGHLVLLKPEFAIGGSEKLYRIVQIKGSAKGLKAVLEAEVSLGGKLEVAFNNIDCVVCYDSKGREQFIEYHYSETQKVVRTQWTDRREAYSGKQTKKVRPWHLTKDGKWVEGKGDADWPLYRQDEAHASILSGEPIISVAGEQVVEALRALGLTAFCPQGGERNYRRIGEALSPTFQEVARLREADADSADDSESVGMADCKPFIVSWGDNDPTGQDTEEALLKDCYRYGIPAVAIDAIGLWAEIPYKGDAKDWIDWCRLQGMTDDEIRYRLTEAIEEAIDQAEVDARYRWQRSQWNAPVSHQGEIGFWNSDKDGNRHWAPTCNFDFQVERELRDSDGGGVVLQIKRCFEVDQHRIILNSCDYTSPDKFTDALKRSLGTGIVCNLSKFQLNALMHSRLHEYRTNRQGKVYKRIDRYGQQEDGTWVFRDRQITKDGTPTTEDETGWVFNPNLGRDDFIPCPEQAEYNPDVLKNLYQTSKDFFGAANINQTLYTIGWTIAGIHAMEIFAHDGCFPLFDAHGEPGSCKTLAAETALSLIGKNWPQVGMLARVTTSALYEHGSRTGSLPFFWDDPERSPEAEELLKSWFNWKPRKVRGNEQTPRSPLGATTNHVLGGEQAATYTRIARVGFEKAAGGNKAAFQDLKKAQEQASGAFPLLLKIGYDSSAIASIELELLNHLPQAHARIAQSIAIIIWYAEKFLALVGGTEDIRSWVIKNICQAENDADNSGDSLQDFLDKVRALESESLIGDWNYNPRYQDANGQSWIAIHYSNVWHVVDGRMKSATYNLKALKTLVIKAGGHVDKTVRFAKSRDEVLAYYRALIAPRTDDGVEVAPNPPETKPCKAWLLPISLLGNDGDGNDDGDGTPPSPPPTTPITDVPQPHTSHPSVTDVNGCNQKTVTASNPDISRDAAPQTTPCNHVTEKLNEKVLESEEANLKNEFAVSITDGQNS
ncbi:MAG TPA: hypothetical protein V6D12_10900, partial [Candidatus Obscuribacterales bacterium]